MYSLSICLSAYPSIHHTSVYLSIQSIVSEHPSTSNEFFRLLARLINHSHHHNIQLEGIRKLLETELKWLEEIRVSEGRGYNYMIYMCRCTL